MIRFTVPGRPQPQGSMRAFKHKHSGAVVTMSDNKKLKPWRATVKLAAVEAAITCGMRADEMIADHKQVFVGLDFYFAPPKKMPKGREGMTTKPDIDKLVRASLDSLTGILYKDDSQVTEMTTTKRYGLPERTEISVEYLKGAK